MPHPGTHPGGSVLTMVEHTVAVLSGRCAPVFVIAAERQQLPELDARVLRDEIEGAGPLVATGRGLRAAAAAGLNRAFVSAVDMPYLSVAIIEALAGCRDADIVLPWDGRDHYLAAIYRTALAEDIDTLITAGARSMRALTESVVTQRVVVPAGPALTNVNVESDLL